MRQALYFYAIYGGGIPITYLAHTVTYSAHPDANGNILSFPDKSGHNSLTLYLMQSRVNQGASHTNHLVSG